MNNLLKTYVVDSGYKLQFIASQLGITYVALHNKLENKNDFTLPEMSVLKSMLNIPDDDFIKIFNISSSDEN